MDEPGTVTRVVRGIDRNGADDGGLARRICQACVDGLDVDGAAISVLTSTVSRETLWASDATADLLEDLQFALNEGVCMQAAHSGRPALVPDLLDDPQTARWPVFAAAVVEQSLVRALFALPLQWGAVNLGVLDMYRATPGALSAAQLNDAVGAVDAAASKLLAHRTDPGGRPAGSGGWLDHPVRHRAEIHQATGMVVVQLGISAADALARMRAYSFVHQRLLIDVSRDVIRRSLAFADDMA
jgi:GAF domain-containing protein